MYSYSEVHVCWTCFPLLCYLESILISHCELSNKAWVLEVLYLTVWLQIKIRGNPCGEKIGFFHQDQISYIKYSGVFIKICIDNWGVNQIPQSWDEIFLPKEFVYINQLLVNHLTTPNRVPLSFPLIIWIDYSIFKIFSRTIFSWFTKLVRGCSTNT